MCYTYDTMLYTRTGHGLHDDDVVRFNHPSRLLRDFMLRVYTE